MNRDSMFKMIISGHDASLAGDMARAGLTTASRLYEHIMNLRNRRFDKGIGVYHADVPVISVGNITVGGTGKTPMVRYICDILNTDGYHTAVLSRGYKAENNKTSCIVSRLGTIDVSPTISGDEAWLLAKSLPQSDVIIGRSRATSAALATSSLGANRLVLDDGFQHRQLARDLDILLIDASNPFGFGYVLPRGLLREPLTGLSRADMIMITKVDQVPENELLQLRRQLKQYVPHTPIGEAIHKPTTMYTLDEWMNGKEGQQVKAYVTDPIMTVTGIGNPESFEMTLTSLGYRSVHCMAYEDHYNFTNDDLVDIWSMAFAKGAKAIVITEKDAVKFSQLPAITDFNIPIYVLAIGIECIEGEDQLRTLIRSL